MSTVKYYDTTSGTWKYVLQGPKGDKGDTGATGAPGTGAVSSVNTKTGTVVLTPDDLVDTSTTHKFVAAADKTNLANLSGTNTGDETATTIKTKLAITTLSGSNTGDQTTITGNAGTATKLATARNINGVAFDGTAAITVADATKVPTTTTVNTHALSANITLVPSDLGLPKITESTTAPASPTTGDVWIDMS